MKKVKAVTKINGEIIFNLASTAASDDWIRSARLLKEGKTEEVQKLDEVPMYYFEESLRKPIRKRKPK